MWRGRETGGKSRLRDMGKRDVEREKGVRAL
jgi:hypothetical protein